MLRIFTLAHFHPLFSSFAKSRRVSSVKSWDNQADDRSIVGWSDARSEALMLAFDVFQDDLSSNGVINKTRASGIVIDANWFNGVYSVFYEKYDQDLRLHVQHGCYQIHVPNFSGTEFILSFAFSTIGLP